MFKKMSVFVLVAVFVFTGFSAFVGAQEKHTLEDYGISPDAAKYLSPAEIQAILNSKTPTETAQAGLTTKGPSIVVSTSSNPNIPPSAVGVSASTPTSTSLSNTVNCFDYYNFGSIDADISSLNKNALPGMTMQFVGNIRNNNSYPVVGGSLYVKIFRERGIGKDSNGPDVVDQFIAVDDLSIAASGTVPVSFSWKVPLASKVGDYKLATYFVTDRKFNLLGLSFTDDVIGNTFSFSVSGVSSGVEFDKTSATINGEAYHFAAFPPQIDPQDPANISIKVNNTTNVEQNVGVTWKLYSWDALTENNLIRTISTSTLVKANSSSNVSINIKDNTEAVYYLVAELNYKDAKSVADFRFVRTGVDKVRLSFPSILQYPLKEGANSSVFACVNNSGTSNVVEDNKVVLKIVDSNGNEVTSYTYDGSITGAMMAVKKDFIPSRDLASFSLVSEIYHAGVLVGSSTLVYDCNKLDPTKCKKGGEGSDLRAFIISLLLIVVLVALALWVKAKKKINMQKTFSVFLLFGLITLGVILSTPKAEAKDVVWSGTSVVNLDNFANRWGGSWWTPALQNPNVSVTYHAQIKNKDTGAIIADGSSVPVGTHLTLSLLPQTSQDISWFGTGFSGDSPYGEWRDSATPSALSCSSKDFVTHYHDVGSILGYSYSFYFDVYIPLVLAPLSSQTITNTSGMTCTATSATTQDCTVTTAGAIAPKFNFSSTYGKFYYRYYDTRTGSIVGGQSAGCYGNNVPLQVDNYGIAYPYDSGMGRSVSPGTYVVNIPSQTITYNLTATDVSPDNHPPTAPIITGPTTGTTTTSYIFNASSTDQDGDNIMYGFDWNNNGVVDQWTELSPSGFGLSRSFAWATSGAKTFEVMAQDSQGATSDWSSYTININDSVCSNGATDAGTCTNCPTGESLNPSNICTCVTTPGTFCSSTTGNLVDSCGVTVSNGGCLNGCSTTDGVASCNPPASSANIEFTSSPARVQSGGKCTLNWSIQGANSCTLNGVGINDQAIILDTNGDSTASMQGGALTSSATYTLRCISRGLNSVVSKTASCSVNPTIIEN